VHTRHGALCGEYPGSSDLRGVALTSVPPAMGEGGPNEPRGRVRAGWARRRLVCVHRGWFLTMGDECQEPRRMYGKGPYGWSSAADISTSLLMADATPPESEKPVSRARLPKQ
jgi:hypothetical protein